MYKAFNYFALMQQATNNSNASSQTLVKLANFRVSVVFLLGISPTEMSDEQQSVINYEHEKYGKLIDISHSFY
jgi:hypothetical protein